MSASNKIPTVTREDSVAFDWGRKSEMIVEHNTCQLKFSTSDGSAIVAPIFEVMHAMNKLFKCDKEWGIISMKGAAGANGRTYIQSKPV
ncbi:hypothetical protein H4Q26_001306 [Puccinia striiformis f. sp. tritici PST-130]|nr:hypothetical protein H4Q26_001306 [Puccinia striiformis f. sp. tritici PST-130]